jgi:hypothetical protein
MKLYKVTMNTNAAAYVAASSVSDAEEKARSWYHNSLWITKVELIDREPILEKRPEGTINTTLQEGM